MKPQNSTIITLKIDSLANSGDGVARFENKVIFVPFALPGEKVRVEVLQDKKSFAKARLLEVLERSPHRVEPRCPVFGQCGGCDWQNLSYDQQLLWKQKNLAETLQRIGKLPDLSKVEWIRSSPKPFHYRNRIQLHLDKSGPFYFSKGGKQKVHIQQCPIASQSINSYLPRLARLHAGLEKIELAEMDDGEILTFKVDEVGQSEMGFRQVNLDQNNLLNDLIQQLVSEKSIKTVVDLYCGQGNWSNQLGRTFKDLHCVGIDNNPINIRKAKEVAPPNCEFLLGDAVELLKKNALKQQLIIIDPPRSGCSPAVVEQLQRQPSDWLVYISCHPATMARDLNLLLTAGWTLHRLVPVDMFPQTSHLECLAILQSANGLKTANP